MERKVFKVEIVEKFRKDKRLTIKEFCKLAKISIYAYSQFKKQDLNITVPKVFRIAEAINIDIVDLFYH